MKNFELVSPDEASRVELHDKLGLTGCEISINQLAPASAVPFVHCHKANEEVYGVLEGAGKLYIDGEVVDIKAGDWFVFVRTVAVQLQPRKSAASNSSVFRPKPEAFTNSRQVTP